MRACCFGLFVLGALFASSHGAAAAGAGAPAPNEGTAPAPAPAPRGATNAAGNAGAPHAASTSAPSATAAATPVPTPAPTATATASDPGSESRRTVAVVPFASTGGDDEHRWIGSALAAALATRVALQPELNTITIRQVNAALRQDNLEGQDLTSDAVAAKLGKLLGADLIMVGAYSVAPPKVELTLKSVEPFTGKLVTTTLSSELDKLVDLEAQSAVALARALGVEQADVTPGTFGTLSLEAWRNTTLAHAVLDWQSLSPSAADPKAQLSLPTVAIEQARKQLLEAIAKDADYGEAWASLGLVFALQNDTKQAWRCFGKATALGFGHHPTAVVGASFVRMREGRFDEAANVLRSAIARRPGFLLARGYLGELYNHLGRHREALAVFTEYAAVAPKQPWVLAQVGYTKSRLGDYRGAVTDTIAAVDIVPDSPSLLIQLASRYIDANKLIGAEDALMQALKLFPDETRAYVRLGYVYLLQGKDDLAIPVSEKALVQAKLRGSAKDRAYAHLNLARAYGHKGDLERAFDHLMRARSEGLTSLAEVERDPLLDTMRHDPRYQKLLN